MNEEIDESEITIRDLTDALLRERLITIQFEQLVVMRLTGCDEEAWRVRAMELIGFKMSRQKLIQDKEAEER